MERNIYWRMERMRKLDAIFSDDIGQYYRSIGTTDVMLKREKCSTISVTMNAAMLEKWYTVRNAYKIATTMAQAN